MIDATDNPILAAILSRVFDMLRSALSDDMGVTLILRHRTEPSGFSILSDDTDLTAAARLLDEQIPHLIADRASRVRPTGIVH